jgi:pyruvate/2-oxoglutarate dehydrogenase complex dihydrolipoamide acyltransferase (E2) component
VSEDRNERPDQPAMERAEELVDRLAQGAGYLVSVAGYKLLKGASLAREEVEDIWAEAQNTRREWQSAAGSGGDAETVEATDAARRRARELNVDLRAVRGTGAGGRITVRDVEKAGS